MNDNVMIDEKLLTENADFLKAVVAAKTIEDAQKVCAEYNIELPEDAWKEIQQKHCAEAQNAGELKEDELDAISGGKVNGSHFLSALGGVAGLGAVVAAGSPAGVLVACAWIGYHGYKAFW